MIIWVGEQIRKCTCFHFYMCAPRPKHDASWIVSLFSCTRSVSLLNPSGTYAPRGQGSLFCSVVSHKYLNDACHVVEHLLCCRNGSRCFMCIHLFHLYNKPRGVCWVLLVCLFIRNQGMEIKSLSRVTWLQSGGAGTWPQVSWVCAFNR